MATTTNMFGFIKPELSDPADITATNANWDKVASELATRANLENGKVPMEQLPEFSSADSQQIILYSNLWTLGNDERYYQTVTAPIVNGANLVFVDVDLDSTDDTDAKITYLEEWNHPSANEVDHNGSTLTFYAWEKPTVNIPVLVGVI